MLEALGHPEAGEASGARGDRGGRRGPTTPDIGGRSTTREVGRAIEEAISASGTHRAVSRTLNDCELTFQKYETIDVELARKQHAALQRLRCARWGPRSSPCRRSTSVPMPSSWKTPPSCWTSRPGPRHAWARRAGRERSSAVAEELAFCRRVLSPPQGSLEGGDVIRAWKTIFVGISRRTDEAGAEGLRTILQPYGYGVIPVKVRGALHLKTACSYPGRNMLLLNSAMVDTSRAQGL